MRGTSYNLLSMWEQAYQETFSACDLTTFG